MTSDASREKTGTADKPFKWRVEVYHQGRGRCKLTASMHDHDGRRLLTLNPVIVSSIGGYMEFEDRPTLNLA